MPADEALLISDTPMAPGWYRRGVFHLCSVSGIRQRNPQLHDVRDFDFRNNVIHRWGVYGLRARAGTTGNVMHNFFGSSSNPKKNSKSVLVLMSKENAKSAAGPIHVAGNLGPGKFNLNTIGTAPRALRAPPVTVWKPAQSCRYIIQRAGARPLDGVDQALLKGLADFPTRRRP